MAGARWRPEFRAGVAVAALHLAVVLALAARIIYLGSHWVAQWQLEWLDLEWPDWPVSQLLWWPGWPRGPYESLPYLLQDPLWFAIPLLIFGVLGSAWYGLLGCAITWVFRRVRMHRRRQKANA